MAQRTMTLNPTKNACSGGLLPAATGVTVTNVDAVKVWDAALKLANQFTVAGGQLVTGDTLAITIVCPGTVDG